MLLPRQFARFPQEFRRCARSRSRYQRKQNTRNDWEARSFLKQDRILLLQFGHFERAMLGKFQMFSEHLRDGTTWLRVTRVDFAFGVVPLFY
jgi:hypothetical protein